MLQRIYFFKMPREGENVPRGILGRADWPRVTKSGRLSATVPKYGFPTGRFVKTHEISAVGNILLSHGGMSGMHPLEISAVGNILLSHGGISGMHPLGR